MKLYNIFLIESIPFETTNPKRIRSNPQKYKNIYGRNQIGLQAIGSYSKSDLQHPIRTQNFKISSLFWIQYKDNQPITTYENSLKKQVSPTSNDKTKVEVSKILRKTNLSIEKSIVHKTVHQFTFSVS